MSVYNVDVISEEHFIKMDDKIELNAFIQEVGSKLWLVSTHGLGEHKGRHEYLENLFSGEFNICQYDLRGHGLSQGPKAYVHDFWDYMRDLHQVLIYLKNRYKMDDFILFGHSMGALITAGYLQKMAIEELYPKVVFLNAPPVGYENMIARILGKTPHSFAKKVSNIPISILVKGAVDLNYLSHDILVKEDYLNDKNNQQAVHSSLLFKMIKTSAEIFNQPLNVHCKTFVTVGTEDKIISVKSLVEYFKKVERNCHLRQFKGAYHEIYHEVEKFKKHYLSFIRTTIYGELKKKQKDRLS